VKCDLTDAHIKVTGPKGALEIDLRPEVEVKLEENTVVVTRSSDRPADRAFHGMTRALINNMVQGVTEGYQKELTIIGVGYRGQLKGKTLNLTLGYSHPISVEPPEGITFEMDGTTTIKVSGISKELVGQTAAKIRALRKPEPYKGKGVRYTDEHVHRKAGKTAGK
jgi:large subunit ribosomal protein L6